MSNSGRLRVRTRAIGSPESACAVGDCRVVIALARQCLSDTDDLSAFCSFDRLSNEIIGLCPSEFDVFCTRFPYADYVRYAMQHADACGRMALVCADLCLSWDDLDMRCFLEEPLMDFSLEGLENDSPEGDCALDFLANLCTLGGGVPEYLIGRGLLERLGQLEWGQRVC